MIEDGEYTSLAEAAIVKNLDGYIIFCDIFKYLGTLVPYSLCDNYDITKQVAVANAATGSPWRF